MNRNKYSRANAGLPPLDQVDREWSWFEFWPVWFFYLPVVVYWILQGLRHRSMGLPMLANPNIPLGGMVGESKAQVLNQAGPFAHKFILPFVSLRHSASESIEVEVAEALSTAKQAGLTFPLVAKPDLGCRGLGVRVMRNAEDLQFYLSAFPDQQNYLLQQLAPWQAEAGIFYVRMPGADSGSIKSITLKYVPTLTGDGSLSFAELLDKHPRARKLRHIYMRKNGVDPLRVPGEGEEIALTFSGSHCRGSIFRNGNEFICKEMNAVIDNIMQDFPEFHYGRLDVKFRNMAALQAGEDFCVIEINGASSEATHIWDSRTRLRDVFVTLFWQYRTLFDIGRRLRDQGKQVPGVRALLRVWINTLRMSSGYPQGE